MEKALADAQEEYKKKLEEALQEERERSRKAIDTALEEERSNGSSHIEELKVGVCTRSVNESCQLLCSSVNK